MVLCSGGARSHLAAGSSQPKVVLLIFVSGKLVITGAKNREQVPPLPVRYMPCSGEGWAFLVCRIYAFGRYRVGGRGGEGTCLLTRILLARRAAVRRVREHLPGTHPTNLSKPPPVLFDGPSLLGLVICFRFAVH